MVIKNSIPERLELNSVREGVQVKKKQLTMLHMQHIITFIILANIFIWSKDVSMKTQSATLAFIQRLRLLDVTKHQLSASASVSSGIKMITIDSVLGRCRVQAGKLKL